MRKISIIILVIFTISLTSYFFNNHKTVIDFKDNKYSGFSLNDFGNYDNIYCQETKTGTFFFPSFTNLVVATYDTSVYDLQIDWINNNYIFLQQPVKEYDGSGYAVPEPEFDISNWHFKVIDDEGYPNYINLIAYNSSDKKIAYLSFIDTEINSLCEESEKKDYMKTFIKKYFRYNGF